MVEAWELICRNLYPMTELTGAFDANYDKFQETADYFSQYRKFKTWQDFRSDAASGYSGYTASSDAFDILKKWVFAVII